MIKLNTEYLFTGYTHLECLKQINAALDLSLEPEASELMNRFNETIQQQAALIDHIEDNATNGTLLFHNLRLLAKMVGVFKETIVGNTQEWIYVLILNDRHQRERVYPDEVEEDDTSSEEEQEMDPLLPLTSSRPSEQQQANQQLPFPKLSPSNSNSNLDHRRGNRFEIFFADNRLVSMLVLLSLISAVLLVVLVQTTMQYLFGSSSTTTKDGTPFPPEVKHKHFPLHFFESQGGVLLIIIVLAVLMFVIFWIWWLRRRIGGGKRPQMLQESERFESKPN